MAYAVKSDPELGIVEVAFTGRIDGSDLREATSACIALQRQTRATRFLVDMNDGSDVVASTLDVLDLPGKQYWDEDFDRLSRVAVILPASGRAREAALFYKAACQNRGWEARLFLDRQSALEWLQGAAPER